MIVKTYGKPGEGMTFEQKKKRVKHILKYFFFWVLSIPLHWFIIGLVFGSAMTVYAVTDALTHIDKLLVCK